MCEMFLREDELLTRHSIYEVYTKYSKEECFDKLNDFYQDIEKEQDNKLNILEDDFEIPPEEDFQIPIEEEKLSEEEQEMQPQEVLDLF